MELGGTPMRSKHTPGKWKVFSYADDPLVVVALKSGAYVAKCSGISLTIDNAEELRANADLIAAAPDMLRQRDKLLKQRDDLLSACKALLAVCTECKMDAGPSMIDGATWDDLDAIRAAIAKAEGGAK